MTIKIGAITIGQSPRTDVTHDILPILGSEIQLLEAGALDGLTLQQIAAFAPYPGDYVLVSKMADGKEVRFAKKHVLGLLQNCIDKLQDQGVSVIVFLCTGDFPDIFVAKVPLIFPNKILHALVPAISKSSRIATITPSPEQVEQSQQKWSKYVNEVVAIPASPYQNALIEIEQAATILQDLDIDLVVMDCIGYSEEMKQLLRARTGKNILLSRTILARIIKELA